MPYPEESELVRQIDAALAQRVATLPDYVREPLCYCLSRPAKRLRALTALYTCSLLNGDCERALPAAVAIELVHNFTLVHDDLMDDDGERRGSASVHVRFGSARAVLAGDALLALAVSALGDLGATLTSAALPSFAAALGELCRGQALDHELESASQVDFETYLGVARRKTGALFALACVLGGRCAGASAEESSALAELGNAFGVAYQLRDDWKDYFSDTSSLGRRPGSDHRRRKKTSVAVLGRLAGANRTGSVVPFDVERRRLRRAGVHRLVEAEVQRYRERALASLLRVRSDAQASALWAVVYRALTLQGPPASAGHAEQEAG